REHEHRGVSEVEDIQHSKDERVPDREERVDAPHEDAVEDLLTHYWTIWNLPSFTCCTEGACFASRPSVNENLPSGVSRSFTLASPASMSSRPLLPPACLMASAMISTPVYACAVNWSGDTPALFIEARNFWLAGSWLSEFHEVPTITPSAAAPAFLMKAGLLKPLPPRMGPVQPRWRACATIDDALSARAETTSTSGFSPIRAVSCAL